MSHLAFIGVGVMGEPMCRHLTEKSGIEVRACDTNPDPLERLAGAGTVIADDLTSAVSRASVVFLSLPGGPEVAAVAAEILPLLDRGATVVDLSTSPVSLTRDLAAQAAGDGIAWADAPVARTRAAAEAGTLAVMVGADDELFAVVEPLISCFASDVSHCGEVGCGQIAKIMNNMILFQNVVALAEAMTIAERAGMDPARLLEVVATGSGDSFALHNHATKAMLPRDFPLRAFSTDYARKDLSYALQLAADAGVETPGAEVARRLLEAASEAGHGDEYWPTLLHVVDERIGS